MSEGQYPGGQHQGGQYPGPWPSQLPAGSFPGMPQKPVVPKPTTIKVAFWLLIATAVVPLALVPFLAQVLDQSLALALAQASAQSKRALPPGFYQDMMAFMVPMLWISSIIGVAIEVLLALGIWTGRNWVRILLTVLVGLNFLGSVFGFAISVALPAYPGGMYLRMAPIYVFSFAIGAAKIAALVLAWLPASNAFFAMSKAARTGYLR
ncbi:hypothetical protein [Sinomonas sp. ASV322]|uniref:hypothetical protein n=1 Tax=Sinomonas sp. ASV322 TaxID=3041920 RepID=UPI0027DC1F38|nr:hypothetical protein [Sinomonas sp. ASV322]MDQ4503755.1 hypothetical protein [Sinomonas sp. ASV322]